MNNDKRNDLIDVTQDVLLKIIEATLIEDFKPAQLPPDLVDKLARVPFVLIRSLPEHIVGWLRGLTEEERRQELHRTLMRQIATLRPS